jgi:hypothetical protein
MSARMCGCGVVRDTNWRGVSRAGPGLGRRGWCWCLGRRWWKEGMGSISLYGGVGGEGVYAGVGGVVNGCL